MSGGGGSGAQYGFFCWLSLVGAVWGDAAPAAGDHSFLALAVHRRVSGRGGWLCALFVTVTLWGLGGDARLAGVDLLVGPGVGDT